MSLTRDTHSLVTQAAFLFNQEYQMLILQLPDGRWQLPGGKLRRTEHWGDGLRREIFEETALDSISVVRVLYIDNWYTVTNDYYRAYFLCTTVKQAVQLSNDHIRYHWIDKETNLDEYLFTHATIRRHIRELFAEL